MTHIKSHIISSQITNHFHATQHDHVSVFGILILHYSIVSMMFSLDPLTQYIIMVMTVWGLLWELGIDMKSNLCAGTAGEETSFTQFN